MVTLTSKDAIKQVVDLFDAAEDKIKEVEQLSEDLPIPSINELRYAGYHLARAYIADPAQNTQ